MITCTGRHWWVLEISPVLGDPPGIPGQLTVTQSAARFAAIKASVTSARSLLCRGHRSLLAHDLSTDPSKGQSDPSLDILQSITVNLESLTSGLFLGGQISLELLDLTNCDNVDLENIIEAVGSLPKLKYLHYEVHSTGNGLPCNHSYGPTEKMCQPCKRSKNKCPGRTEKMCLPCERVKKVCPGAFIQGEPMFVIATVNNFDYDSDWENICMAFVWITWISGINATSRF